MVVATEDNTEVAVYYPADVTLPDEYFTLNLYEVFTMDTYDIGRLSIDFTGTRVVASKPVSVYSGVGRVTGLIGEVRQRYLSLHSMLTSLSFLINLPQV